MKITRGKIPSVVIDVLYYGDVFIYNDRACIKLDKEKDGFVWFAYLDDGSIATIAFGTKVGQVDCELVLRERGKK